MKFRLTTSGSFYDDDDKNKLEKLGFKFRKTEVVYGKFTHKEWYKDYSDGGPFIEFFNLEEVVEFSKQWGGIIVNADEIEIYDDYRE